jgi:hypothetical protein
MNRLHWRHAMAADATGFPPLKKVRIVITAGLVSAIALSRAAYFARAR